VKQIVQSPRTGKLELLEVPAPTPGAGQVLVRNLYSVVSPGTERMAMGFARKSLLGKARSRPDLVRQVVRKLKHEGPLPTYRTVMGRLDAPQPLGYSCAGVVESVGEGVGGFAPGDRVACAGAGYANHAELVVVPENLVALVPDGVAPEHAAFATIGAIALQGIRVAEPSLGEVAAVVGLGLIGQLAVQLLRANGCRVLGIDIDRSRVETALAQGAEWACAPGDVSDTWKDQATGGYGADFALVTAAAETSEPIQLAAELCRAKGRVAVVGQTAMDLDRRSFYEKELELRMSMSYGPGRYDRRYEELGLDYPISYVRWTENRNLQAFLALLASGSLRIDRLDTETLPFTDAERAYDELASGARRSLALIFRYAPDAPATRVLSLAAPAARPARDQVGAAFIGAGNYAKNVLLPALQRTPARPVTLVTATGPSARRSAEKFGFATCGTDPDAAFGDKDVDLVFVATRHDMHAPLAIRALRAGKAVWVEKPLAVLAEDVDAVADAVRETQGFLAVGYNRRFSPHARAVRKAFAARQGPLSIHYVVAAGPAPAGTWHLDPIEGGGRIVGEGCHFVDLCAYLVGSAPALVYARVLGRAAPSDDSTVAMLGFADGSTATLEYLARASAALPKERFEASADGRTARCDNFRVTKIDGAADVKTMNQDKGQATAVAEVVAAVRDRRPSPFALDELVAVSRATLAILESARTGRPVAVTDPSAR
jgi:predicted dehydrogenase/threonine dehydrogenase-like Zn-dependent dehydrogenase